MEKKTYLTGFQLKPYSSPSTIRKSTQFIQTSTSVHRNVAANTPLTIMTFIQNSSVYN